MDAAHRKGGHDEDVLSSTWAAEALPVGPSMRHLSATGASRMISGCHRLPTTCSTRRSACKVRPHAALPMS